MSIIKAKLNLYNANTSQPEMTNVLINADNIIFISKEDNDFVARLIDGSTYIIQSDSITKAWEDAKWN